MPWSIRGSGWNSGVDPEQYHTGPDRGDSGHGYRAVATGAALGGGLPAAGAQSAGPAGPRRDLALWSGRLPGQHRLAEFARVRAKYHHRPDIRATARAHLFRADG